MNILKAILIVAVVLLVSIQFFPAERTNPPIDRESTIQSVQHVPAEVDAILRRSCYDCHSNETKWPWYSYIAPTSWLVVDDVREGRSMMNFTEWGKYSKPRAAAKLDMVANMVREKKMPLPTYLLMHPKARLSSEEIDAILEWTTQEAEAVRNSMFTK